MHKIKLIIFSLIFSLIFNSVSCAENIQEGLNYYNSGNFSRAEKTFRNLLYRNPNDYTAKYMLAVTLVNLQNYNEAKQLYKNVINNSNNQKLASLSRTGLKNLGENVSANYNEKSLTKAVLSVSNSGSGIIVNNVTLNNDVKTKFIFDTGATYMTISKRIAAKLNLSTRQSEKIKIVTASGYVNAPLVRIPKVEVNGLFVRNVEAIVMDLPSHTAGNSGGVAGLLGLSFLENFRVTVDRAHNQVILEKN